MVNASELDPLSSGLQITQSEKCLEEYFHFHTIEVGKHFTLIVLEDMSVTPTRVR